LGGKKGIRPVKKWVDGGRWALDGRMEWHPADWLVSASVNLPLHHKSRSSLLAPAHLGGPGKGCKMVVCVCISSQPRAAHFRPAFEIRTKATTCVEVWQTSNVRLQRLGEEKKEKRNKPRAKI